MKKSIWDKLAPLYKIQIRKDKQAYEKLYKRISKTVKAKEVLELGTGPGAIAKNIAHSAKHVLATDYSEGMIKQAKKGVYPDNVSFRVVDAMDIPYEDNSFDVVIIANALHVVPDAKVVLDEIKRVLKKDGVVIAPNYINAYAKNTNHAWPKFLEAVGIKFNHTWSDSEYKKFIEENGFSIIEFEIFPARIPIAYLECRQ